MFDWFYTYRFIFLITILTFPDQFPMECLAHLLPLTSAHFLPSVDKFHCFDLIDIWNMKHGSCIINTEIFLNCILD